MDNASSNDLAIEKFKKKLNEKNGTLLLDSDMLHMKCVYHITNLIVSDGDITFHCNHSECYKVRSMLSAHFKRFKKCVGEDGIELNALLCVNVPTR